MHVRFAGGRGPAGGDPEIVVATTGGVIAAYDLGGRERWQTALPADPGDRAWVGATPAVVDGRWIVIDAATGAIRDRGALDGPGRKFIQPAVVGARVFVTSCSGGPDTGMLPGASHLEGWDLVKR